MGILDAPANAVPRWQPNHTYKSGQLAVSPLGDTVTAALDHTSGATFTGSNDNGNWSLSSTFNQTATGFGLRQGNGTAGAFDNFAVL